MFGKGIADSTPRHNAFIAIVLSALSAIAAHGQGSGSSCSTAIEVDLNATYRQEASEGAGSMYFKVSPGSAGVLTLQAVGPGDPADRPVIAIRGTICDPPGGEGDDYTLIAEKPTSVAVEMLAGETLYFELAPEDAEKTLPRLKLSAAFVSDLATIDEETEPTADPGDTCGTGGTSLSTSAFADDKYVSFIDDIDEWDDDVISSDHVGPGVVVVRAAGPDLDAEIYAGTSCTGAAMLGQAPLLDAGDRLAAVAYEGEHRLVLGSHDAASGEYTLSYKFFDVCAAGEADDHGDGLLCATLVASESETAGALDNAFADDGDVFTFSLAAQQTVWIETTGTSDTYGILLDKDGQRLDWDDDAGADQNFRMAKTLTAGQYFVRIEGAGGAEGSYDLLLDHVSPP